MKRIHNIILFTRRQLVRQCTHSKFRPVDKVRVYQIDTRVNLQETITDSTWRKHATPRISSSAVWKKIMSNRVCMFLSFVFS